MKYDNKIDPFQVWVDYFTNNAAPRSHPNPAEHQLTEREAAVVGPIQLFQLGEGSDGKAFQERARAMETRWHQTSYLVAAKLFMAEERRHSALLESFLTAQGQPTLTKHWADSLFRRLRQLAGLEVEIRFLVAAEVIAEVFYRALHEATASPYLKSACQQILDEESKHIEFQGLALNVIGEGRGSLKTYVARGFQLLVLTGATVFVWKEHKPVFVLGGYSFGEFFRQSFVGFRKLCSFEGAR
jgi:hypothetical protein